MGNSAYIFKSSGFPEYFFNRAAFMDCAGAELLARVEKELKGPVTSHVITVQDACAILLRLVRDRHYALFDRMIVLSQAEATTFRVNTEAKVEVATPSTAAEWAKCYVRSFYGTTFPVVKVSKIASAAAEDPNSTLLMARAGGGVVACLAVHRTDDVLGIYCVGTLRRLRGKGFSSTLLRAASKIAASEGRTAFLQTIASDGYEGFYSMRGFSQLYSKGFFKGSSKLKSGE